MLSLVPHSTRLASRKQTALDRAFDDLFAPWSFIDHKPYRLTVEDGKLSCEIDMPGLKPENVQVQVTDQLVTVTGKGRGGEHSYSFQLSAEFDASTLAASMSDGVLTLTAEGTPKPQPRTIVINTK